MKTIVINKPARFNSPLYAVHALFALECYQFILFRGKAIQRVLNGFRAEIEHDKWSKTYRYPLQAIERLFPCPTEKNHQKRTPCRTHVRRTHENQPYTVATLAKISEAGSD